MSADLFAAATSHWGVPDWRKRTVDQKKQDDWRLWLRRADPIMASHRSHANRRHLLREIHKVLHKRVGRSVIAHRATVPSFQNHLTGKAALIGNSAFSSGGWKTLEHWIPNGKIEVSEMLEGECPLGHYLAWNFLLRAKSGRKLEKFAFIVTYEKEDPLIILAGEAKSLFESVRCSST